MSGAESFYALTPLGRIGLLTLSVALCVAMIFLTRVIVTGWPLIARVMLSLILLWAFIWLSPQVFFSFYSLFFDEVPKGWVVKGPPPIGMAIRVITFTGPADVMHHAQGALGILMVFSAIVAKRDPS